jgi:hypothetical protein
MMTLSRSAIVLLIAVTALLAVSCNGDGGIGLGPAVGPQARWGGGSGSPGVIVMGGGPVY